MKYILQHVRRYWYIYTSLLIVVCIGAAIAYLFRNQINPDGVSYFQIAKYYASFDISKAVNGYWSPLLSWLLVPFFWLGVEPGYAYRALIILLSIAVIGTLHLLLERRQTPSRREQWARVFYISTLGILINLWGGSVITPDMLSGVICVLGIFAIYYYLELPNRNRAIFVGTALALLYFSRSIGIYIGATLLLCCAFYLLRDGRLNRSFYWASGSFLILCSIWIGLLFLKYERLQIATSGAYNTALYGPEAPTHPHTRIGFLEPQYPDSVWAWDDPSHFNLPTWDKLEHIWYFKFHFIDTLSEAIYIFFAASPLVALGIYVLLLGNKQKNIRRVGELTGLVIFLVILVYSYILYIEPRYLWLAIIPLLTMVCIVGSALMKTKAFVIFSALMFFGAAIQTASLYQKSDNVMYEEAAIKNISRTSSSVVPLGSTVVGTYPNHYKYCYYSHTTCVGSFELAGDINQDAPLIESLRANGVDYYVDFSGKDISYLPAAYESQSSLENCFNANTGKNQACAQLNIRVYDLDGSAQ